MEHRGSNPNLQCHKLPCCHYTMDHILKVGASVGIRTLINCLQGSGTTVMLQKHVGVRGGTRTRKTCVLSAVPMPIRLHGQVQALLRFIGLPGGSRTRKTRILSTVRMPIPTPEDSGISARIRTGRRTLLRRPRIPFRHEDIWRPQGELNPCPRRDKPV